MACRREYDRPVRSLALALIAGVAACEGRSTSKHDATMTSAPTPAPPPTSSIMRSSDGRCTPVPIEGTPCARGDSWCVLSWGSPGGHSSTLWCRDGRWEREEERNLPR